MVNLSVSIIALRLGLALVTGLLLGLDRTVKNKPVDFRVYIIVSITAALVAMVNLELVDTLPIDRPGLGLDPDRVLQAVLMGIAFLGSATIIKHENHVIGTATGATVWAAGAIGLALGFGFYVLAIGAFACIFGTLVFLELMHRALGRRATDTEELKGD